MTQVATLRKILLRGNTVTQRSALMDQQIMALPRRIADLKEEGFPVKTVIKINPTTGQRYAEYSMDRKVTSLKNLQPGCVYRVKNVRLNVFHNRLFDQSKGYFVADRVPALGAAMVRMAGTPQFILEDNLIGQQPDIEIEYVGGMA